MPAAVRNLASFVLCLALGVLASPAAGLPIISELFYDAVGSDNGHSFVELYGAPGASLEGFTLEGVNGANGSLGPIVALSGVIPGDGLFVVADDLGDGSTLVPGADLLRNFDFQNGPDSVLLRFEGSVVDAVGYGAFAPEEVFAGEGLPALDAPAGSSLARYFADFDSDDNQSDFAVQGAPTPGSAALSVPEPAGHWLMALGLGGLACASRRRARAARELGS